MSKLLIVIDMQKGFDCKEAKKVIDKFNKYSSKFEYVVFTKFENRKGSLFETQLKWVTFQNEYDKEIIEEVNIPENAYYTKHHNYTVYNDDLKELIKKLNPSDIYLSGLFSDVCLLKTAMDMFDNGIVPYIVEDLSASPHGDDAHKVAFATMEEGIGSDRVISVVDVC